jgi:DNA polymerase III sliding clamp (beta) subunit (PCNA family)
MRSIGELARDSGLSVSALRFYDGSGVFVPAWVDPVSGYRWYAHEQLDESRLLARLRRAGVPLADIRLILTCWSGADTDLVDGLLQAHLRRLEAELAGARNEVSAIRSCLDSRENLMTLPRTPAVRLTVPAAELAAALDAVRYAASSDPDLPMLSGILFDIEGDSLQVVASDRYRLAVARVNTAGHGGSRLQVIVPSPLADAMRALLSDDKAAVQLTVDGDQVALDAGDRQAAGQRITSDFPDYRRIVRVPSGHGIPVDVAAFQEAVRTGPVRPSVVRETDGVSCDLSVLTAAAGDVVAVCEDGDEGADQVAVNREFLLQALAAAGRDRLILEFAGPVAPLAIRRTDTGDAFSLLMPVRLDH